MNPETKEKIIEQALDGRITATITELLSIIEFQEASLAKIYREPLCIHQSEQSLITFHTKTADKALAETTSRLKELAGDDE